MRSFRRIFVILLVVVRQKPAGYHQVATFKKDSAMRKTHTNGNGRLAVLTVAICFSGLPVHSAAEGEMVTEPYVPDNKVEQVVFAQPHEDRFSGKHDFSGKGCWRMVLVGDSAYRNVKVQPPTPYYKFFGDRSALMINLIELTSEKYFKFIGATGNYREKKGKPYVRERGVKCPRTWLSDSLFDDTWKDAEGVYSFRWKDDKRVYSFRSLWKTGRWERCEPPTMLKNALDSYRQSRHRKDCLRGTWKLKAVRNAAGEMEPTSIHQYKFYGKDAYITFVTAPLDTENMFYTFSGNFGSFEFVNDNLVREHDSDFHLVWTDEDHFTMTFRLNGRMWEEEWEHVRTPRRIRQMFRAMK